MSDTRGRRRARPVLGVVLALALFVPLAGASHGETRAQSSTASRASAGRVPARVEAVVLETPVATTATPTTTVPTTTTVGGPVARPATTTTVTARSAPVSGVTSTAAPTSTILRPTTTFQPTPTVQATTSTAVPASTTTSTSTTVAPCHNSTDPACGPFRFLTQPGVDSPMTLQVVTEPATPRAGQDMAFRITLTDPDGVSYGSSLFFLGDSGLGESSADPCTKFGPWDPPARDPAHAVEVQTVRHTYAEPGSFTSSFAFDAGPFDCTDSVTGRGDRPYASSAKATLTVTVTP